MTTNADRLRIFPNPFSWVWKLKYSQLKETLFEDERVLYFLIFMMSLFTIGFLFSVHQKNIASIKTKSHSNNKISTANIVSVENKSILHDLNSQNKNFPNKHETTHDSYAMTNNQIDHLKALLLPLPQHFHKNTTLPSPPPSIVNSDGDNTKDFHSAQSCFYNGQSYLPGDIVKTDNGWIRCSPTFSFSQKDPTKSQSANPTWTTVQ